MRSLLRPPKKRTAALVAGVLFLLAFLPRLVAIDRYITPDELNWVYRSVEFRQALLTGNWSGTLTAGHPGVTTTWLGALGISAQLAIHPADQAAYDWITHLAWLTPENGSAYTHLAMFLTAGRLAVALLTSLGVVAIYWLARPTIGRPAALLASFLLALDPFNAGLSGLLHVDSLTATFATLALLCLLRLLPAGDDETVSSRVQLRAAAGAGALAALAILTKSPALLLLPFAGLALLLGHPTKPLSRTLTLAAVYGIALLLTALIVLPALWASPTEAIDRIASIAGRHVETALRPTFFMGRVAFDHGPIFYPVALAFRLSPLVVVGLLLSLVKLGRKQLRSPGALFLLLWVILFAAGITLAAKKFDRYILPAIPALVLVAALGWSDTLANGRRWLNRERAVGGLVAIQALLLIISLPYPLSAYNILAGGHWTAAKVMTIGWGEGISASGRWLAQQPGADQAIALAGFSPALAPFFPGTSLPLNAETADQGEYVILTHYDRQLDPTTFAQTTANLALLHTIRYGGLEQAWIYARPESQVQHAAPPADLPAPYTFGDRVQLVAATTRAASNRIFLALRWRLAQPGGRYTISLTVKDEWGHRWLDMETPLLNDVYFYPDDWPAGESSTVNYTLKLPKGTPPAPYSVHISLYESESGAQLPLLAPDGSFDGVAYKLEGIEIPVAPTIPTPSMVDIPHWADARWANLPLVLLGTGEPATTILAGDVLTVELYWQVLAPLPAKVQLALALGDQEPVIHPLSRTASQQWRAGELFREKYSLPVAPQTPAGSMPLNISLLYDDSPTPIAPVALHQVAVETTDRLFELPQDIPVALDYTLGDQIQLYGLALEPPTVVAGDTITLTLFWQANVQPDRILTAFVHLLAADNANLTQSDQWPGGLPSTLWAPGQVIIDRHTIEIPFEAPAGEYPLTVGLYDASSGLRLPVVDQDATRIPDDRINIGKVTILSSND